MDYWPHGKFWPGPRPWWNVGLVLDTGHITLTGMALAKNLDHRVIENHFKDTKREDRGGTKNVATRDMTNDPYFYPLGEGGVDRPANISCLTSIGWRGHLNVELDTSP